MSIPSRHSNKNLWRASQSQIRPKGGRAPGWLSQKNLRLFSSWTLDLLISGSWVQAPHWVQNYLNKHINKLKKKKPAQIRPGGQCSSLLLFKETSLGPHWEWIKGSFSKLPKCSPRSVKGTFRGFLHFSVRTRALRGLCPAEMVKEENYFSGEDKEGRAAQSWG